MLSYSFGITKIGSAFFDLLNWVIFEIIKIFYNICNSLETLISYMVGSTFLESFFNSSIVTSIYSFSISLGVVFLVLFGGWQILKRNLEPDKSAPLGSIVWEILKCAVIISCWGLVFTTAYNLSSIVQDGLISTVNEASNVSSIADTIIVSFTSSNNSLLTNVQAQNFVSNSLNTTICGNNFYLNDDELASCISEGTCSSSKAFNVSFWGCSGKNSTAPIYNLRGLNASDVENLLTKSLNKKADDDYDYIFNMHTPYLLITIIFFTIALLTVIFTLFTRVFELVILFVIAPAVIGSSICRQETRSNLWRMLSSLLLQSLGTVLILYFGISFMSTIASYSSSNWGVLTTIIFKMAGIIAVGFAMMRGSKVIQTFISEQAGLGQGFTGTLTAIGAMVGAGALAGKGVKMATGTILSAPAGIADARRALSTHSLQHKLGAATSELGSMDLNDPNYGTTLEQARGLQTSLQNKISENAYAQSTSVGGRGVANKLAQKGDKLMGHTPRQLNSKADSRLAQSAIRMSKIDNDINSPTNNEGGK